MHLRRHAAVVLCPPIGYEYMSAYQTLRILAVRFAALGFDALRFDYDGTGDSAGSHNDPNRVAAWLQSVSRAIAEARRLAGSEAVALVGLRAGALLALDAAAAAAGVDRLVLWSPSPSGRAYVRELKAFAAFSRQDHADDDGDEPGINAAGHFLSRETVEALERWTLDTVTTRPAVDVLLVERDDRHSDPALQTDLERLGSRVTRIRPAGTAEMLVLTQDAKVPERALDAIATWLDDWRPLRPPGAVVDAPDAADVRPTIALHDDYCEQPVHFSDASRLFGILTSPINQVPEAPSILLFNTGVEYHVGPHRLFVPLAREWAAQGHHVLRFDLGGIGDSAPPRGSPPNVAYPSHMLDDANAAIELLRREAPQRRVIAAGMCSGGWLAFEAARKGLRVDAIVSINPPLYLREGAGGAQWVTDRFELERYQQSLRDPSKWMKALRGGASYATFMRVAASAMGRRVAVRVSGVWGDGLPDGLARDLGTIAGRGIKTLFVFSRGDDGFQYFQHHAAPALRRARVRDLIQHVLVDGAGHTFRPRHAQLALRELLTDFVQSQTTGNAD
jgi:alpha-beta hydrolase superfamily lysophospholipase